MLDGNLEPIEGGVEVVWCSEGVEHPDGRGATDLTNVVDSDETVAFCDERTCIPDTYHKTARRS